MKAGEEEAVRFVCVLVLLALSRARAGPVYFGRVADRAPEGTAVIGFTLPGGVSCPVVLRGERSEDFSLSSSSADGRGLLLRTTKTLERVVKASYVLRAMRDPGCSGARDAVTVRVDLLPGGRRRRDASGEPHYTVALQEGARPGDVVFTVPDERFIARRFEVLADGGGAVRVQRDSGRVYLARALTAPTHVTLKVHNARGEADLNSVHCDQSFWFYGPLVLHV